ncbi:hypothetical protein SKAU_G00178260 [Synaphobranchus kaupii]|uniref:Uncharacterized protein n=1 Tax=Synaphobranchus kaupii TaxID=118154 RepID=A0A9Q1FLY5_SYNKA|nr:hypothetical protein SKAU_G00178260 [Synaphobranchus kaupii]
MSSLHNQTKFVKQANLAFSKVRRKQLVAYSQLLQVLLTKFNSIYFVNSIVRNYRELIILLLLLLLLLLLIHIAHSLIALNTHEHVFFAIISNPPRWKSRLLKGMGYDILIGLLHVTPKTHL